MLYKANWAKNEKAALFRTKPPLEYSQRGIGVMGKSWEEKRILYFDDIQKSEFLSKEEAKRAGLTSVLLVPIFYNDRVIAMFNFFSEKPFSFEQISSDLINKISKQIGSDIQNQEPMMSLIDSLIYRPTYCASLALMAISKNQSSSH